MVIGQEEDEVLQNMEVVEQFNMANEQGAIEEGTNDFIRCWDHLN